MRIAECCAIITGAGSGLGRRTAQLLHQAGARVVLLDLNREAVVAEAARLGDRSAAIAVDVRNANEVQAAIDLACNKFGAVHVAVNCAGLAPSAKTLSRGAAHDLDLWRGVIDINLTGTFNVMRLAALSMAQNMPDPETGERGVIVNTASIAAFEGQKGQVAYAASKAGIVGMTLPVARDLADHAIRCVAIAPGLFETELLQQIPEKGMETLKKSLLYPPRLGAPAEFVALVQHIIENPYLNGSYIRLDGGVRMPA